MRGLFTSPSPRRPLDTVLREQGGAEPSTHAGGSPIGCRSSALGACAGLGTSPWGWLPSSPGEGPLELTHLEHLLWLAYF